MSEIPSSVTKKDLLWTGSANSGSITLSRSLYDYDFLVVQSTTNTECFTDVLVLPALSGYPNHTIYHCSGSGAPDSNLPQYRSVLGFTFASNTQINISVSYNNANWKLLIKNVYGVKL